MHSNDLLKKLSDGGFLKTHTKDTPQAKKLLTRAFRDIKSAKANLKIDEEVAYTLAYLAMLRSGRALMFLKGLRPVDGGQHMTVVKVTGYFLGAGYDALIYKFDKMRQKRNQLTYEPDLPLGLRDAEKAIETAEEFMRQILKQVMKENPQLELNI
ncbi:MAG: HEPN domain-containing protein [bacterium]